MMNDVRLAPLGLALLASAAVCGGCQPDEQPASTTDDPSLTVKPVGTDQPGKLLVRTPDGAHVASSGFRGSWNQSGTDPLPINRLLSPIAVGRACFFLLDRYGSASRCVDIASLATTTVDLGAVRYAGPEEMTIGADSITWTGTESNGIGGAKDHWVDDRQDVVRPAGVYHLAFGLFDGIDVTVQAGQTSTADLASLANRRAVDIASPDRELPNAPGCGAWTIRGSLGGETRSKSLAVAPAGRAYRLGEYARGPSAGTYVLEVGRTSMDLLLSAKAGDAPRPVVRPGRIDVADVDVLRADGSRVLTRGTYTLQTNAGGLVCSGPTNTGVDVAPGTYRLVTTYTTAEAGAKTTTTTVNVP